MKKYYSEQDFYEDEYNTNTQQQQQEEELFGCNFCWDSRKKKDKELFFLDQANNMRICNFCPYCGRKYEE